MPRKPSDKEVIIALTWRQARRVQAEAWALAVGPHDPCDSLEGKQIHKRITDAIDAALPAQS